MISRNSKCRKIMNFLYTQVLNFESQPFLATKFPPIDSKFRQWSVFSSSCWNLIEFLKSITFVCEITGLGFFICQSGCRQLTTPIFNFEARLGNNGGFYLCPGGMGMTSQSLHSCCKLEFFNCRTKSTTCYFLRKSFTKGMTQVEVVTNSDYTEFDFIIVVL